MSTLYIFFILIIIATTLSIFFNKKIGDTIFPALATIMLYLFVLGVFNLLEYTILLTIIPLFFLSIFNIKKLYKNKEAAKKIFINPSMLYIIIVFMLTLFLWNNSFINKWDEFSQWGVYVKNIFLHDSLWNNEFTSVANGYPPIVSILQYFFMKLDGFYSEPNLFKGLFLLSTLPMVSFCKQLSFKKPVQLILFILLLLFVPSVLSYDYLNSVYLDTVIGILLFASIYNLITEKISLYNFLYCNLILSIIILSKSVGLVLFGIFYMILFIDILFIRKEKYILFYKKELCTNKYLLILIAALPMIFRVLWSLFLRNISVGSKLSTTMELNTNNYTFEIINNFIEAIFKKNIGGSNDILSIPSFYWFIIIIFAFIFIKEFIIKKEDTKYIDISIVAVCTSFIIYTFALLFSYLYSFGSEEALVLASFERYMITILNVDIMLLIIIEFWLFVNNKIKNKIINYIVILFILMTIRIPEILVILKNSVVVDNDYIVFNEKYKEIDILKDILLENESIYYISTDDNDFNYLVTKYKLTPNKTYNSRNDLCLHCEINSKRVNIDELKKTLLNYNYIYFYSDVNSIFSNNYCSIFVDCSEIKKNSLYKINKDGENFNLQKINKQE